MTTSTYERSMERIDSGGRLTGEALAALAASPDILALGMLADALRRRQHGTRVTYLRIATWVADQSMADAVPQAAREIVIMGSPVSLEAAVNAVRGAREVAGARTVAAFSWADVDRLGGHDVAGVERVLGQLRAAGLDAIAELPLDTIPDPAAAIDSLVRTDFRQLRLTIEAGEAVARDGLWLRACELQDRFGCIQALSPLPQRLRTFRPTTGYDDVKALALARLAAPNVATIQVDWSRYGPKLAQVALTFGADDVWGVSASDAAPEGRRRAAVEEIRRNVEAAGFDPVERDGRFIVAS